MKPDTMFGTKIDCALLEFHTWLARALLEEAAHFFKNKKIFRIYYE